MTTNRITLFICFICSFIFLFTALLQRNDDMIVDYTPVKQSQRPFYTLTTTPVGQLKLPADSSQGGIYHYSLENFLLDELAYQSNNKLTVSSYAHLTDLFLEFSENKIDLIMLPSYLYNPFILGAIPDIISFDTFQVSHPFASYVWLVRMSYPSLTDDISCWANTQYNIPEPISPFDHLFKQEATRLNWNWRLLAALSFEESRFDTLATSPSGAKGLMQLMPETGYAFGLNDQNYTNPKANIVAGVNYLSSLQSYYKSVKDPRQKTFFVLAAFHAGIGHVDDAQRLTKKYGHNPLLWEDNVAVYMNHKADSIYAGDEVVKHGIFPGKTTNAHVRNILKRYTSFLIK